MNKVAFETGKFILLPCFENRLEDNVFRGETSRLEESFRGETSFLFKIFLNGITVIKRY